MSLIREALTDENHQGDIAYLAIAGLTLAAIGALTFIFAMSTWSYANCKMPCAFDPLPVGQAAGLIFGAFGALIGALAGYMAATRKPRPAQGDQNIYSSGIGQVQQPQTP